MKEYSFDAYYKARGTNWYETNTVLKKILHSLAPKEHGKYKKELVRLGAFSATTMNQLASVAALKKNEPQLKKPAFIQLCPQTQKIHKKTHTHKLGFLSSPPLIHYAKLYLLSLNGEAGICCSLACTDGCERILRKFKHTHPEIEKAYNNITKPTSKNFYHAAQFVTEIQGGSDVAANQVQAEKNRDDRDYWKISGLKWFCSNINADYFLLTARSTHNQKLSLFLVPRNINGKLNHFSLRRLKDKFGTRELATAEVDFKKSIGFLVGEEGSGVSLVVSHVLVTSRIHCSMSAGALLYRAFIETQSYCHFRKAFGKNISEFSLVRDRLDKIEEAYKKVTCGFFELLNRWSYAQENTHDKNLAIDTRILISLYKVFSTQKTSHLLREAMMLLGANGMEETFSPLPRLLRDSIVYETWEGPHFVLLTQAFKDMQYFGVSKNTSAFVKRTLGENNTPLSQELKEILDPRLHGDDKEGEALLKFEPWAESFINAFQNKAAQKLLT